MKINESLKNIRLDNNLTQDNFAEKLGVTRQTISSWENGKSYPDIENIIKISEIFNISLDNMLKEYQSHKKVNYSQIKTIVFGKLNEGDVQYVEDAIDKLVNEIDNIV